MIARLVKFSYFGLKNEAVHSFCKECGYPVSAVNEVDFTGEENADLVVRQLP